MILRVSREHFQTLWCCLTLLRKLGGKPVIIKVEHVSGIAHTLSLSLHPGILRLSEELIEREKRAFL
jgi:RNase P/RNase MRP subunit POP5